MLVENRVLQRAELDARLEAQLAGQVLACAAESIEGIGLAAGAIQRQHQLPV